MIAHPTKKKIGFFGGSFDPIHFGHINLALQLFEIHKLDQMLVCPALFSPLKRDAKPQAGTKDRYAMAELALSALNRFELVDTEIEREGPSYTIDTLKQLMQKYSAAGQNVQWHLILGEDSLVEFSKWKNYEELVRMSPPLIGSRSHSSAVKPGLFPAAIQEVLCKGMTNISLMEISSTVVRDRIRKKQYCEHLTPLKVLDYIEQNHLYCS